MNIEFEPILHSSTDQEKKKELFEHQKHTLDLFLERGAITKAQYDKSLGTLIEKLGNDGQ